MVKGPTLELQDLRKCCFFWWNILWSQNFQNFVERKIYTKPLQMMVDMSFPPFVSLNPSNDWSLLVFNWMMLTSAITRNGIWIFFFGGKNLFENDICLRLRPYRRSAVQCFGGFVSYHDLLGRCGSVELLIGPWRCCGPAMPTWHEFLSACFNSNKRPLNVWWFQLPTSRYPWSFVKTSMIDFHMNFPKYF